jgi:membrane-bound serine protease (ClpP class)
VNWTLYLALLVAGILLVGLEIFVPGGVLGVLGGLCLVGAIVVGFQMSPTAGWLGLIVAVLGTAGGLWLWIRIVPKTRLGQQLTLSADGKDFKAPSETRKQWLGREGIAQSDLRPSGIARIDGQRVDVVAEGAWIPAGTPIRVVAVDGIRVTVRPVESRPDST